MKLDGYRIVTVIENGQARLFTRNGNDWTDRFSSIAHAAERLPLESAILDGEVVAMDDTGIIDFQRLQNWVKRGRQDALVYYVFDLPYAAGYDLTQTPLVERKRWLASSLLTETPNNDGALRYSDHICGQGHQVIEHACRFAMEGVVSKQADSPYQGRRTKTWVKIKCLKRQEFVIGGYTKPSGSRIAFGALLLGYYDNDRLVYCGRVGTGFTEDSLRQIKSDLAPRRTNSPAFDNPPTGTPRRGVTWVRPELVAEVEFAQWTDDGQLRHPAFHGLREDKPSQQIVREEPMLKTPGKHSQSSKPKRTRSNSDRYIATSSKARRQGKVFIDYLRNQRGATAVACYSTRARPNASVATPLRWDEIDARLKPDKYTVLNLRNRLSSLDGSPWPDFHELRQSITKSMLSSLTSTRWI